MVDAASLLPAFAAFSWANNLENRFSHQATDGKYREELSSESTFI